MTLSPHLNGALLDKLDYLALVAGEPSGDILAADVIKTLNQSDAFHYELHGIGGLLMQEAGLHSHWPMETLTVRGYVEAISQLPSIIKVRSELINYISDHPPKVYVGIDAPDFNLGIESIAKKRGIPTVHFISPSIWAWRKRRIKKIQEAVDHMLCIFPFETEIYKNSGVQAVYVGHPLASQIPMLGDKNRARVDLKISTDTTTIAVLPGSRLSEIKHIAPTFFSAIGLMSQSLNDQVQFVVPVATPALREPLNNLRNQLLNVAPHVQIYLVDRQASLCLESADSVLIASGTATLEAALWKKPMVISYKVPRLTAWIMKRQGYLPYIGLPNILSGKFVVPEILQDEATPEVLANATLKWLDRSAEVSRLQEHFTNLHQELKLPTSQLVADVIRQVAGN